LISIETTPGNAGESMVITVTFSDVNGNSVEHVNYDIMATQGSEIVLDEEELHDHDGFMIHKTMALPSSSDVSIIVSFNGFGINPPFTGPIGQIATKQVSDSSVISCGPDEVLVGGVCVYAFVDEPSGSTITVNPPDVIIPSWIKDVAGFWCGDEIDDSSFIEAIQYLINNDVIIVPTTASSGYGSQEIPSWIQSNACWWSQGLISNSDFASGLQYLIGQGIIRV